MNKDSQRPYEIIFWKFFYPFICLLKNSIPQNGKGIPAKRFPAAIKEEKVKESKKCKKKIKKAKYFIQFSLIYNDF